MTSTDKVTEGILKEFEQWEREPGQPAWLHPFRKAGIARFAELGFPTLKHEDWRFTNVAPITKLPFHPVREAAPDTLDAQTLAGFILGSLPAHRLVFVNGQFAPALSSVQALPAGVVVTNLRTALVEHSGLMERNLGQCASATDNGFAALNCAFFHDGGFVHLPRNATLDLPVHLVFVATATQAGAQIHPRNLILADAGSRGTVIESYANTVDAAYFTNAVTEIVAGESTELEHVKVQDESLSAFHIAAIHASLGRASQVQSHSLALGARLSRNNIRTHLGGEGLECVLNGLYLTKGDQLADHHMLVEHAQPNCASHEYFNGILDDKSKGVFHGRILVRPIAQKTDAKQTNKNLLLSDSATADSKPQLEIYADDVKCTHGATIGQLSEESIFYLRSRGLGQDTARRMLIHAFAGEITERIWHDAVREELDQVVWDRLEAHPLVAGRPGPGPHDHV
ncbi:MAG: Fe-S cluster assembly protein SufD [Verrucomicrobia bacterium]|jgi:Fe-S cluster assembly protein SufD|nr:Fe-S cluster assembly protein SufD [Verrucomicrobiota bacterium]